LMRGIAARHWCDRRSKVCAMLSLGAGGHIDRIYVLAPDRLHAATPIRCCSWRSSVVAARKWCSSTGLLGVRRKMTYSCRCRV
jgi:hypothetical protein